MYSILKKVFEYQYSNICTQILYNSAKNHGQSQNYPSNVNINPRVRHYLVRFNLSAKGIFEFIRLISINKKKKKYLSEKSVN